MNGIWGVDNAGFGNVVFLNRDPREAARQKKQFESSLDPLPCGMGMERNERGDW